MARAKKRIMWDGVGDFNEARRKFYDSLTDDEFAAFVGAKAAGQNQRRGRKARDRRVARKAA